LKFVYANQGVGRFTKLGIPFPHFTASFIGGLEVVGGLLLLAGLTTRLIAIPFVGEMIVAIISTKISLYLGTSPSPLLLPPAPQVGFWAVLHEVRSEYAQMLTAMFLIINGPGKWSLDAAPTKGLTVYDPAHIASDRLPDLGGIHEPLKRSEGSGGESTASVSNNVERCAILFDCKLHYSAVFITRLHSLPRPTHKKRDLSSRKKTVNENRCFRLGALT